MVVVVGFMFVFGLVCGDDLVKIVMIVIVLVVVVILEGLLVVVIVMLVFGMYWMVR